MKIVRFWHLNTIFLTCYMLFTVYRYLFYEVALTHDQKGTLAVFLFLSMIVSVVIEGIISQIDS